jgi:two-component system response regulator RegA
MDGSAHPSDRSWSSAVSVLLIDESQPFVMALQRALAASGMVVVTADSFAAASALIAVEGRPTYIVSELKVGADWLLDFISETGGGIAPERVFVATAYPSVASAVRLTRMGVAGYLTKPVCALDLIDLMHDPSSEDASGAQADAPLLWPTLDRTVWEYISRVHATAGSISEAAKRLGVDRRSLRRMLAKHPPSR